MSTNDPLDQLHDIRIPDDISAWPPGIGWWIITGIILVVSFLLTRWLWCRLRPALWRLRWSRRLPPPARDNGYFVALNQWWKAVAIDARKQPQLATLSGSDWIDYLHQQAPDMNYELLEHITLSAQTREPLLPPQQADQIAREWLRRQTC